MSIAQLALIAATVEALVQAVKPVYDKSKGWNIDTLLGLVLGVIAAILTQANMYAVAGIDVWWKPAAWVLTGLLFSRGANVVHDLYSWLQTLRYK